jgi:hypothetical protein
MLLQNNKPMWIAHDFNCGGMKVKLPLQQPPQRLLERVGATLTLNPPLKQWAIQVLRN